MINKIIKIDEKNYHRFDDMVYWRINGKERSFEEKKISKSSVCIPTQLSQDYFYVYAIEEGDKFVGWISLFFMPKVGKVDRTGYLFVDELWIEEGHRGLGYSKTLMSVADKICRRIKATGIRLDVNCENEIAQALYKSCGYKPTGRAYTLEKCL